MPDFHIPNDPEWQWAYDLILYGVGEEFPEADPTALRGMGEELYGFTSQLLNGVGATANLGNALGGSLNGPAATAFAQFQGDITKNVPTGGQISSALGDAAYQFALDSESTQYNIVIAAFTQVVEIAIAMSTGFGAAAVPALIKIGQEIVGALISFLRARLQNQLLRLAWEGIQEGLEELWQSAAAQLTQIAEGNRKTIDYKDLLMAFLGGVFIGAGVSGMHMIAGKFYPKINKNVYSRETLSGLAETLFEGLFGMMVGGGGFNPFATFSSSVLGGMAHHYAQQFGNQFGPTPDPNSLRPPPTLNTVAGGPNNPNPPAVEGPNVPVGGGPSTADPSSTNPAGAGPTTTSPSNTNPAGAAPTTTSPSNTNPAGAGPVAGDPSTAGPASTGPTGTGPT
ncbi:MAG: hypothetical protein SYR96_11855, partial [Actinomycetota bacterium]|nr:hypothetical protein [Actinomycetota bacterium]